MQSSDKLAIYLLVCAAIHPLKPYLESKGRESEAILVTPQAPGVAQSVLGRAHEAKKHA